MDCHCYIHMIRHAQKPSPDTSLDPSHCLSNQLQKNKKRIFEIKKRAAKVDDLLN